MCRGTVPVVSAHTPVLLPQTISSICLPEEVPYASPQAESFLPCICRGRTDQEVFKNQERGICPLWEKNGKSVCSDKNTDLYSPVPAASGGWKSVTLSWCLGTSGLGSPRTQQTRLLCIFGGEMSREAAGPQPPWPLRKHRIYILLTLSVTDSDAFLRVLM